MAHSIFLLTKLLFYSKAICYSLIILSPFRYKSGGGHKYISFLYLFSVDSHSSICNLYSFLIPISFYFQTWLSGLGAGGNTRGMHFESSHRPYHLFLLQNLAQVQAATQEVCKSLCQVKFCLFVKSFKHVLRVFFYLCVCTYISPLPLCVLSLSVQMLYLGIVVPLCSLCMSVLAVCQITYVISTFMYIFSFF